MSKKRIVGYVQESFKKRLDILLLEVGWSEAEYVEKAMDHYFPVFDDYVQRIVRGRTAPA